MTGKNATNKIITLLPEPSEEQKQRLDLVGKLPFATKLARSITAEEVQEPGSKEETKESSFFVIGLPHNATAKEIKESKLTKELAQRAYFVKDTQNMRFYYFDKVID